MAFKANLTITMLFTGEAPTPDGFARMLASFQPAK
jgi:hypothetical protein